MLSAIYQYKDGECSLIPLCNGLCRDQMAFSQVQIITNVSLIQNICVIVVTLLSPNLQPPKEKCKVLDFLRKFQDC